MSHSPPVSHAAVPSGDFLALLASCDDVAASLLASVADVTCATADMVARKDDSCKLAALHLRSFRCALLLCTARGMRFAKRVTQTQGKSVLTCLEAFSVSCKQLHRWAAVARSSGLGNGGCAGEALPLLDSQLCTRASPVALYSSVSQSFAEPLGSVVTGDGLRVVSAAGPGLQWFEPHSRSEFTVVLVQTDSRFPSWLMASDVSVSFSCLATAASTPALGVECAMTVSMWCSVCGINSSARSSPAVCSCAQSPHVAGAPISNRGAALSIAYTVPCPAAVGRLSIQLVACGVLLTMDAAAGDTSDSAQPSWSVTVPRRCAAIGVHVRTLRVGAGVKLKLGLAVSADETRLVVGRCVEGTLSVYSLPDGTHLRTFGGAGAGELQFNGLHRMCFAPRGSLLVVDHRNGRVQEVTLEGAFVRYLGLGLFEDSFPFCIAASERAGTIAVGGCEGTGPRVTLLDQCGGSLVSRFGTVGAAPGQLSPHCTGIAFSADGCRLAVAELTTRRVSEFTAAGAFIRCVGFGHLASADLDVQLLPRGEFMVADCAQHRVCVFASGDGALVRHWGSKHAFVDGSFNVPQALAVVGAYVYVMDRGSNRVQVLE